MPTNSVAFETMEGPQMITGANASSPENCFVFLWGVVFAITTGNGLNPGRNKVSGHVVQRVDVSKIVLNCDGSEDAKHSKKETIFEVFDITDGESDNVDTVQLTCLKNRITTIGITLSASFHTNIQAKDFYKTFPGNTNPYGASGLLAKQPDGFRPTLIRKINFLVPCCKDTTTYKFNALAYNSWGTYQEDWGHTSKPKKVERRKIVDGEEVKIDKEEEQED